MDIYMYMDIYICLQCQIYYVHPDLLRFEQSVFLEPKIFFRSFV